MCFQQFLMLLYIATVLYREQLAIIYELLLCVLLEQFVAIIIATLLVISSIEFNTKIAYV